MKYAYKPYSMFPNSYEMKMGINPAWPAEMMEVADNFSKSGWTVIKKEDYNALIASMAAEKEKLNVVLKNPMKFLVDGTHYEMTQGDSGKMEARALITLDEQAAFLKTKVEK